MEQILIFLNEYNYEFTRKDQKIIVNLDFAQKVYIDLSEVNKIKISDKLTGWNFLTGLIAMSLKNAMIYNFISAIILGFIFIYLQIQNDSIILIPIYLVLMLWVLMFTSYYLIKLESFKTRLMNLDK